MNEFGGLSGLVFILGISLLIFLLLREFWCWYWKINKIVSLQRETNELLRTLLSSSLIETREDPNQAADLEKYEF